MRDFSIRLAQHDDLEDCVRLDCLDAVNPVTDSRKRHLIESRIFTHDIILACGADGKPVGYIRFDLLWPRMLPQLGWVYVEPEWRSNGVMAALFQSSVEVMLERGYEQILFSTQTSRPEVMDLFRTMGMKECGRLALYGQPDVAEVFFICQI